MIRSIACVLVSVWLLAAGGEQFIFHVPVSSATNPIAAARLPSGSTTLPESVWSVAGSTSINNVRTLCYQDTGGLDTLATINTQIAGCASGTYVLLQTGSYTFASGIQMKSNVTLRGAGPNSTFLTFTSGGGCTWDAVVCFGGSSNFFGGEENTGTWSAGYTKGTTVITLSVKTNISIGTVLHLDETSDACASSANDLWPEAWRSQLAVTCSYGPGAGDANGGGTRTGRAHAQEVVVTAIEAGSCAPNCDITITPALVSTFSGSKTPQASWPTTTASGVGVEELSINVNSTADKTFDMSNSTDSWVKHVRAMLPGRSNILWNYSVFNTVRDSYFFATANHATTSYGLEIAGGSFNLIENNVLQWITAPVMNNGGQGNVIAFNYAVNNEFSPATATMFAGGWAHNGGTEYLLFEGNDWPGMNFDIQHGTQHLITAYRNHFWGRERSATDTTNAVNARSLNRFYNYLGDVMGTTGYHTVYKCNWAVSCADEAHTILSFGSGYGGVDGPNDDTRVSSSAFLWGNWDVVTSTADTTDGDQTGTRWCGNSSNTGWVSRCGSVSEVPSAIGGTYQQSIPGTETLPTSLYRSSKPSFFKSSDPWPLIGPDVSGGSVTGVGGHVYPNPARQCYLSVMSGSLTGTTVLAFTCSYPLP